VRVPREGVEHVKRQEEMVMVALEKTIEQDACICKYVCFSANTWLINNIRNSSNT
jgi:hypothetical protein